VSGRLPEEDSHDGQSRRAPVPWEALVAALLMVLVAMLAAGVLVRDPGRRRRVLNRAGRTWLQVENTTWRTTRPLRRRQKKIEHEVVRLAKELWDRVDDLVFAPALTQIPKLSRRLYAHGAFMGAAPALLSDPRWRRILAFLMPDVFLDVRTAVERGIEPRALIPMFENNPVVAAFGVWRHHAFKAEEDRDDLGEAMEWDVFLSSALVDAWYAAKPEHRPAILASLVDSMVIAHASTTDTLQEQMGLCQWGDVRKTRKTELGGVQAGAWLDLFARALMLARAPSMAEAITAMQQEPRRHEAEECLKHTFVQEIPPEQAVAEYLRLTGRTHFSVVLEVKSLQIGPLLLKALVVELNRRSIHVCAVGSFQQTEILGVSEVTQRVGAETLGGPREILFMHFVGDVQVACDRGQLATGTMVMFNGASLLLATRDGAGYRYTVDEQVLAELDEYRVRYDLALGLYVQENDCDADAVHMLSELVGQRQELFALGFAWGGVQGEVAIAAGVGDHRGFGAQRVLGQVGVAAAWRIARAR
jgi:hypothetical protein